MPDREKLIRAWEIFRESNPYEICNGREFRAFAEPEYCMGEMIEDTIALLKEQEAVEPNPVHNSFRWFACGKCDCSITIEDRFCPRCGQAVKWE